MDEMHEQIGFLGVLMDYNLWALDSYREERDYKHEGLWSRHVKYNSFTLNCPLLKTNSLISWSLAASLHLNTAIGSAPPGVSLLCLAVVLCLIWR